MYTCNIFCATIACKQIRYQSPCEDISLPLPLPLHLHLPLPFHIRTISGGFRGHAGICACRSYPRQGKCGHAACADARVTPESPEYVYVMGRVTVRVRVRIYSRKVINIYFCLLGYMDCVKEVVPCLQ